MPVTQQNTPLWKGRIGMKRLRTAIVGCGNIAQVHEKVLEEIDACEVIACVDVIPEKAAALASQCGARAYFDMLGMLTAERPDVVHLCTPHALHVPQALMAADAGAAVFMEKPAAVSRTQWAQLREKARQTPVGICFQNRYNPNVIRAGEILREGSLGKVLGVRAFLTWQRDGGYYRDGWHGRWECEGGGTLMNQAIHTLDLMIRFLGEPDGLRAAMMNHHLQEEITEEDTVCLYLTSGERRGLLYATGAGYRDDPVMLEIGTEKGSLRLEEDILEIRTGEKTERICCGEDARLGKSAWGAGHRRCIADFYRALTEGEPVPIDPESCAATMETVLAAYEQCRAQLENPA